ncbi:unnamed protein product [Parajaminaea phylloscopi]
MASGVVEDWPPESVDLYEALAKKWSPQSAIRVEDPSGKTLLELSTEFLRLGKVNNFRYIVHCLQMAFHTHDGKLVSHPDGQPVTDLDASPSAGVYRYHCAYGEETLAPRIGPYLSDGFLPFGPKEREDGGDANIMSHPDQQDRFYECLLMRDGMCLFSGHTLLELLDAAHFIPVSRPECYRKILGLGPDRTLDMYRPEYGLLLRADMHRAFEIGSLALYPASSGSTGGGDGDWIVHSYISVPPYSDLHGQIIHSEKVFRGPERRRPHHDMLMFHYQQCVIKYARCYSHWPAVTTAA